MAETVIALAGGGVEPCAPTDGLAVAVAGVVVVVVVVEALALGCPGANVTKLGPMRGRFPLAL